MRIIPILAMSITIAAPSAIAQTALPSADQAAAFRAAGYTRAGGQWRKCDDPGTAGYTAGSVEQVKDLNGDGLPEAVITEGSTFCFGMTGTGFELVSKQANGSWRLMASRTGMATFLATKGVGGWPDIEIGGPGFCFPVERWNGRAYAFHRRQYEGRPCRR
ncbi:hypothetical protein ACQKOE_01900 [Novosphingobium sp. NPDC080210]|uniref:hypothetical protein n=1 Tax=Novosphingobium sp. NPDC080210 TaxID=3390596 RepID=UPI003D053C18